MSLAALYLRVARGRVVHGMNEHSTGVCRICSAHAQNLHVDHASTHYKRPRWGISALLCARVVMAAMDIPACEWPCASAQIESGYANRLPLRIGAATSVTRNLRQVAGAP
jgi:hypothetical protein